MLTKEGDNGPTDEVLTGESSALVSPSPGEVADLKKASTGVVDVTVGGGIVGRKGGESAEKSAEVKRTVYQGSCEDGKRAGLISLTCECPHTFSRHQKGTSHPSPPRTPIYRVLPKQSHSHGSVPPLSSAD